MAQRPCRDAVVSRTRSLELSRRGRFDRARARLATLMMHTFLTNNTSELIRPCQAKVAAPPKRAATEQQLANGIPMFLGQLIRTLEAEDGGRVADGVRISGTSDGAGLALSE